MAQRIIVIGAGITGLASAAALQRRGHVVTVFEARTDTSQGSAISIWPNAMAALDEIGLGDAVRESGGRVSAGAMRWSDGRWLRRPSPGRIVRALGEPLVVMRRSTLTKLLTDAVEPGTVEIGLAATGLAIKDGGVRVTMRDGTTRTGTAVVGADGVGSMVARHLNGSLNRRYTGYTAWRGIAAYAMDADYAGETLGAGTQFGHVPLGPKHTYWFGTERRAEGAESPRGELHHLRSKYRAWAEPIPSLLASTDPADVLRDDLYDRETAHTWSRGPIVLVGDAAHPMRPHLGQGGCQGLEDATILAQLVGAGEDLPDAFARFATLRRPRTLKVAREARLLGRLVNLQPAVLSAVAMRASALVPESLLMRQLATIAGRSAFVLPDGGRINRAGRAGPSTSAAD